MNRVRFIITLWIAKISLLILKAIGRNATNFPGQLALKLCPDFLKYVSKPKKIIGVTGTNGKTTVCNMLDDFFDNIKIRFICNRSGSNISSGITTTFITGVNIFNKSKFPLAVLEIDERSANRLFPYFAPDYLVITNLFRDSLMRNAHSEFISNFLNYYIPKSTKLILNGNDLTACGVAPKNKRVYFGIDKLDNEIEIKNNLVCDVRICPKCGSKLIYDYVRYNHIGFCHCENCSFKNPNIDYLITKVDFDNHKFVLKSKKEEIYDCKSDNIINIYNMLAAITLLKELNYDYKTINENLKTINIVKSRYDEVIINDHKIVSLLAKGFNPIACSRAFSYVKNYKGKKDVILILDDQHLKIDSSENIAWYFDTDFEFLNDKSIDRIYVGGVRCYDIYNRLILAGVDSKKIIMNEEEMHLLNNANFNKSNTIFILHDLYSVDLKNKLIGQIKEILK